MHDFLDPDENHFHDCYDSLNDNICKYYTVSDFIRKMSVNKKGLSMINFNVRSFNANFDSFISIFDDFETTPDVLVLTETWFRDNSLKEIPYFHDFHTNRELRHSGGVSVYVKEVYESKSINHLSFCKPFIEVCTVELTLSLGNIYIVSIYRPHSDLFDDFISDLKKY